MKNCLIVISISPPVHFQSSYWRRWHWCKLSKRTHTNLQSVSFNYLSFVIILFFSSSSSPSLLSRPSSLFILLNYTSLSLLRLAYKTIRSITRTSSSSSTTSFAFLFSSSRADERCVRCYYNYCLQFVLIIIVANQTQSNAHVIIGM